MFFFHTSYLSKIKIYFAWSGLSNIPRAAKISLFNAILNKIKSRDTKLCDKCLKALTEKDNAIDIIELLDNAIKINNGEELKILFKDCENLVPINRGIPIGAYAFGDKIKSFFNNTKKKVKKAVDNIGNGLKKAKDEVVKLANQAGDKISQA